MSQKLLQVLMMTAIKPADDKWKKTINVLKRKSYKFRSRAERCMPIGQTLDSFLNHGF